MVDEVISNLHEHIVLTTLWIVFVEAIVLKELLGYVRPKATRHTTLGRSTAREGLRVAPQNIAHQTGIRLAIPLDFGNITKRNTIPAKQTPMQNEYLVVNARC